MIVFIAFALSHRPLSASHEINLVVPAERAEEEGDTISDAASYEGPFRGVGIFLPEEFASLPATHRQITGMAFRPDISVTEPHTVSWRDTTFIFSTNRLEQLSSVMPENHGSDATIVYQGDLLLSTAATGPDVGPRPFDYKIEFQRPFVYNPANGSLIIEIQAPQGYSPPLRDDEQTTDEVRVVANIDMLDIATIHANKSWILELTFAATSDTGDFNTDGRLDVGDIDALSAAVSNGLYDPSFDLDHDNVLDGSDRDVWVKQLKKTWFGDANLDREFSSADLVQVFQSGQYEDSIAGNSGWSSGDWNGDGDFNSSDLVRAFQDGGYETGPLAMTAVPEPTSLVPWMIGILISHALYSRRSRP